jgi:hypothetical protein
MVLILIFGSAFRKVFAYSFAAFPVIVVRSFAFIMMIHMEHLEISVCKSAEFIPAVRSGVPEKDPEHNDQKHYGYQE